ncbi:MAG: hypothetical protein KGI60_02975 [Patescibacteria group bacterium]|nr:hypothetical protein [Patescibacteria group bacterium]
MDMKFVEVSIAGGTGDIAGSIVDTFLPEMRRIARQHGEYYLESGDRHRDVNAEMLSMIFQKALAAAVETCRVRFMLLPAKVRIEMETIRDSAIRFCYVPFTAEDDPIIGNRHFPIVLFYADAIDDIWRPKGSMVFHLRPIRDSR